MHNFLATSCNSNKADTSSVAVKDSIERVAPKADPVNLKAEIREQETAMANAENTRNVNAVAGFYADDAVSLGNHQPMTVGGAAIKKDLETSLAKRPKGNTISYEVMDVFGGGEYATETGKTIRKDSTGKVMSTAKYMAIWEKRNGKWICIRDIGNNDAKE